MYIECLEHFKLVVTLFCSCICLFILFSLFRMDSVHFICAGLKKFLNMLLTTLKYPFIIKILSN